jgi:hypothetical protein
MTIHIKKKHLTKKAVTALSEIADKAVWDESKSIRRRMGANGMDNPSMYKTWKWYSIPRQDKKTIIELSPGKVWDKTFLFFFRKFDKDIGLLDKMTTWVDTKNCVSFLAVALKDGQQFMIDGELFVLDAGDSVKFNITHEHEVPKVKEDNLWAVWMVTE